MNTTVNQINPWYITGLVQADGSFFCILSKKTNALFGLQFRPKFSITMDLDSMNVLVFIHDYFGCGSIHTNVKTHSAEYIVDNKQDILNIIIPHFLTYSLVLDKLHSFKLFKEIVTSLVENTDRSAKDRAVLLNKALSINVVTQRTIERIDSLYLMLGIKNGSSIPLIPNTDTTLVREIHDTFIAGFIDGDGSFSVSFNQDGTQRLQVSLVGSKSIEPLLVYIKSKLSDVGSIQTKATVVRWIVNGLQQVRSVIIPFIDKELLLTEKSVHYKIFREVCFILNGSVLTLS